MSILLRAICLFEVGLACFTISDVYLVYLVDSNPTISVKTGLRYAGDVYNPPAAGCNRIPCGLGTNNQPESRLAVNVESAKIGLKIRIENTSFAGKMGFEFRYGDNPQFAIGSSGFPLGTVMPIMKDSAQIAPTTTLTLSPSYTANATIQVYFIVEGLGGRNTTTFYQCVDIVVAGKSPLPPWAADFGPKEFVAVAPDGKRTYDCSEDPRCPPFIPSLSDWTWLILLCVLSFLVLCVCLCIVILCFRKRPTTVVSPPPEPPPPHEDVVLPKETPSTSKVSPYAHFAFSDQINDPPSKKGTDSGSTGDRNTGSQGRHFHFHYEEADPGTTQQGQWNDPNKEDKEVPARP
jgi:hypothetical protein